MPNINGETSIEIPLASERLAHAVDGLLADPTRGRILVAREEGEAVGVAWVSFTWSLEHGGRTAWLEELYVVPARRGRGLGTTLVEAVAELARGAGCAAIDLEVEESHARAARLYERTGFSESHGYCYRRR